MMREKAGAGDAGSENEVQLSCATRKVFHFGRLSWFLPLLKLLAQVR
jgi:hypothetical protein